MRVIKKLALYRQQIEAVRQHHGLSAMRQLLDIWQLGRSPARLGPGDYYIYRLFDPQLSLAQKVEFAGWRMESVLDALNDPRWACLGLDKILTAELLAAQGLRCASTIAVYRPGRVRRVGQAAVLSDEASLRAWLRDARNYPFFSKPSASGFGRGACFALGYEASSDSLVLRDGERLAVDAFDLHRADQERLGYLFQRPLRTDPRLQPALGDLVTSLRVMVLYDEDEGPLIHRAFWKLPTGSNMMDNYNNGATGNLAAGLDMASGRITRVINGIGLELREVRQHPDSGADLHTIAVPDWQELKRYVSQLAVVFPLLRFQQWDIALSDQGPMALELNLFATGGSELSQLLYRRGLVDETMRRFLRRHGLTSP